MNHHTQGEYISVSCRPVDVCIRSSSPTSIAEQRDGNFHKTNGDISGNILPTFPYFVSFGTITFSCNDLITDKRLVTYDGNVWNKLFTDKSNAYRYHGIRQSFEEYNRIVDNFKEFVYDFGLKSS